MKFRKSISLYTAIIMLVSMFSPFGIIASAEDNHVIFAMNFDNAEADATPAPQIGTASVTGNVTFEAAADKGADAEGNKAAKFPGGTNAAYMDISGAEGANLLTDKDSVTISMYAKAESDSNADWLYYAADAKSNNNARNYIGLLIDGQLKTIQSERGNDPKSNSYNINTAYSNGSNWHKIDVVHGDDIHVIYVDGKKPWKARLI